MDLPPGDDQADRERQADKQANVMKEQLRKEVEVWNAARDDSSAHQAADFAAPAPSGPASRPARARRAQPAAAPAPKAKDAPRKPFSMSFDGVTDAEHISYMIARGRR